jgi:tetratricopeptide (TPR) repeat protein
MGIALGQLHKYKEAIEAYDNAIKFKENYSEAYNNKGNELYELGR